jgi:gas vesicle protein
MCENCEHNEPKSFVIGAFFGALMGASLGILFAPDSGEKTRKKIKEKSEGLVEKGAEKAEELKIKAEEIREKVGPYKEKAGEMIQETEDKIREEADNLKKRYFKGTKQQ